MVAAKPIIPLAPGATTDQGAINFRQQVSAVAYQLIVHAKDHAQRSGSLLLGVILLLETCHRHRDERFHRGDIGYCSRAKAYFN